MICNASDDSYIRDIADLTRWMSFSQARVWAQKVWELLRSNAFQNAQKTRFSPKQWRTDLRRIRTAFLEVLGYLPTRLNLNRFQLENPRGGRHISYAIEPLDESGLTGKSVRHGTGDTARIGFPEPILCSVFEIVEQQFDEISFVLGYEFGA